MERMVCYAVIYAAEAIIAWLYFEFLFTRRRNKFQTIVSFLVTYTCLLATFSVDCVALNILFFFSGNLALLFWDYRCALKTAIVHTAFLCFIMLLTELLSSLLILPDFSAYKSGTVFLASMAVVSKLMYLLLAFAGARLFAPHKITFEEPRMMVLFCGLPVLSLLIAIAIVYLGFSAPLSRATEIMILINMLSLLVVNLAFMVLYNYLQKVSAETISLRLSMQKEAADAAYYEALREQSENQRILVHDMKNHLQTIDSLARDGSYREINDYISRLDETLRLEAPARLCGDPILNTVLLRAAGECREKGIDFQCDVREDTVFFLDAPGITTLFGNLLSNAIEAAEVSAGKVVELSVRPSDTKASIIISVVNSCDIAPIPAPGGGFHTRKRDKMLHGIGLKSIGRVVERYRGIETMYYRPQDHSFHHIIQFPSQ